MSIDPSNNPKPKLVDELYDIGLNCKLLVLLFAAVLALSAASDASAQKNVSYEEAWANCKKDVTAHFGPGEGSTAGRYARGGACMKQYGYRLKKSARL